MKTSDCCIQFCNIIRLEKKEIISDWIALIKTVIVEAKEHSKPVLVDHIPQILDNLSDLLEIEAQGEDYKKEIKKEELGKAHGRQRAELTEYSLEEVLLEYSILRKVIINRIHKCEIQDLTAIQLIHKYLDDGMHNAVIEFVKIQNKNIADGANNLRKEKDLRETFVMALTHDLRTPITAARLSAQLIRKNPENIDNLHKQVTRIITYIDRVDYMIQDLLDTNIIKAGQLLPVQVEGFNINTLIENIISDLMVSNGPRFKLNQKDNINGHWSAEYIRRILENLCNNAVKYGSKDAPITIMLEKFEADKLTLCVHNEGKVIPAKELEEMFGQYHRTEEAIISGQKGWGIGLTLVQGLVKALGGVVSVTSVKDIGTTFKVTLPIDIRKFPLNFVYMRSETFQN